MSFFKFRKNSDTPAAAAPAPESVQAIRRRSRNRLVGAGLLVLAGVVGFPLLFDNQPRPIAVDIPIEIPDQAKTAPPAVPVLANPSEGAGRAVPGTAPASPVPGATIGATAPAPASPAQPASAARASAAPASAAATHSPATNAAASAPARAEPKTTAPPPERAASKPADKPADKPGTQSAGQSAEAARAQALLEGKPADKPGTTANAASDAIGRFVVQFGAFTDATKARDVRMKVEKAGLRTYEQVAETADGKKHRVRVGPFERRSDAEKAAEKIKKLDLPATILEL